MIKILIALLLLIQVPCFAQEKTDNVLLNQQLRYSERRLYDLERLVVTAAITGGTINNTTIGATTPSSGIFTNLQFNTSLSDGTTAITEISVDRTLGGNSDGSLITEKAAKTYVDSKVGLDTSLFTWSGIDSYGLNTHGNYDGLSLTPDISSGGTGYDYFASDGTTATRVALNFEIYKKSGVDTARVYARSWHQTTDNDSYVKVDIGGANAVGTIDNLIITPQWAASFDVDISGLSDDTAYEGKVYIYSAGANSVYLSAITIIGVE